RDDDRDRVHAARRSVALRAVRERSPARTRARGGGREGRLPGCSRGPAPPRRERKPRVKAAASSAYLAAVPRATLGGLCARGLLVAWRSSLSACWAALRSEPRPDALGIWTRPCPRRRCPSRRTRRSMGAARR